MRDTRWERVHCSIGTPEIHPSDLETGYAETLKKQIEYRMEVVYAGQRVYQVYRLYKDDLPFLTVDIQKLMLDTMVEKIDDWLEEHGYGKF